MLQRGAFHEFHRDERLAGIRSARWKRHLADFIDGANVGMVQGGRGLCLTVEAVQSLCVCRERVRKELERNEPVQAGVLGLVDNSHPAATHLLDDAVVRDCSAD